jgi:hypothetical protein
MSAMVGGRASPGAKFVREQLAKPNQSNQGDGSRTVLERRGVSHPWLASRTTVLRPLRGSVPSLPKPHAGLLGSIHLPTVTTPFRARGPSLLRAGRQSERRAGRLSKPSHHRGERGERGGRTELVACRAGPGSWGTQLVMFHNPINSASSARSAVNSIAPQLHPIEAPQLRHL